jgi:hypothetical protein
MYELCISEVCSFRSTATTASILTLLVLYEGLISIWLYKKTSYGIEKKYICCTYSPSAPHSYDFVVLTSLTYPRKLFVVVLQ